MHCFTSMPFLLYILVNFDGLWYCFEFFRAIDAKWASKLNNFLWEDYLYFNFTVPMFYHLCSTLVSLSVITLA